MGNTTIEQAAHAHGRRSCVTHVQLNRSAQEIDTIAFIAGAEWQKEQYKEILNLYQQLLKAYTFRYSDAKQLLGGYTNEQAFDKLNRLIEQLEYE